MTAPSPQFIQRVLGSLPTPGALPADVARSLQAAPGYVRSALKNLVDSGQVVADGDIGKRRYRPKVAA